MPLVNSSRDHIAGLILGEALTSFANASAHLGVGDSSTAFSTAQTDLQAATNKLRKAMDATFPTRVANVITVKATFTTAEANFAWEEWGLFNAAAAGVMLNRKVESLGTKSSAMTFVLTGTLTLTV